MVVSGFDYRYVHSSILYYPNYFSLAYFQEWYEGFLKDCPSGELTKDQFVGMYSKIFPSGNADNFSQNIFRTFDTNNSGTIDFRWLTFQQGFIMRAKSVTFPFIHYKVSENSKYFMVFTVNILDLEGLGKNIIPWHRIFLLLRNIQSPIVYLFF